MDDECKAFFDEQDDVSGVTQDEMYAQVGPAVED